MKVSSLACPGVGLDRAEESALVMAGDRELRENLVEILRLDGWRVNGAGTEEEAVVGLSALSPELVLLDLSLAGEDPGGLVKRLRTLAPDSRFVFLSDPGSWPQFPEGAGRPEGEPGTGATVETTGSSERELTSWMIGPRLNPDWLGQMTSERSLPRGNALLCLEPGAGGSELERFLRTRGVAVERSNDLSEVMELAAGHEFDLVVIDVPVPDRGPDPEPSRAPARAREWRLRMAWIHPRVDRPDNVAALKPWRARPVDIKAIVDMIEHIAP